MWRLFIMAVMVMMSSTGSGDVHKPTAANSESAGKVQPHHQGGLQYASCLFARLARRESSRKDNAYHDGDAVFCAAFKFLLGF